jgi:membrane protein implicated in regulation of membrane protease activity
MVMPGWIVWAMVACGFGAGEMLTAGFFLAPFAFGGALAAAIEAAGAGELAAVLAFIACSILTLAIVRPLVRTRLLSSPRIRTGSAALIGKTAVVLERIDNHEGVGCVRIDGEVWTARSFDEDDAIEPGTRVQVVDIRGATALVME